jgi:hypothetical protein
MAEDFLAANQSATNPLPLKTGERGQSVKVGDRYGYYTADGRIVSFGSGRR